MANVRQLYGIAEGKGIDTKGMSPKQVVDALKEKGVDTEKEMKDSEVKAKAIEEEKREDLKKKAEDNEEKPKFKNFSAYKKDREFKDLQFFFGEDVKKTTNKYFTFKHKKSDDEITILNDNVKFFKGNPVMVVDNDKVVYLKDWQLRKVHNYDNGIDTYAIKLNRKFFKPYQLSFKLDNVSFEKEDTFDDLVKVAEEQDKANMQVAGGWMG